MDLSSAKNWNDVADLLFPDELEVFLMPSLERPRPTLPTVLQTIDLIFTERAKEPAWVYVPHLAAWLAPKFGIDSGTSELRQQLRELRASDDYHSSLQASTSILARVSSIYHLTAFIREQGFADLKALLKAARK